MYYVLYFRGTAVGVYCCTGSVVVSVVSVHTVCLRQWVQTLSSGNRDVKGPAPSFHTKPHAIDQALEKCYCSISIPYTALQYTVNFSSLGPYTLILQLDWQ